ncbi:MAG: chromate transporter [Chitinophagales bacterium]
MLWQFFLTALAVGSLTFGGGYAMMSALQQDLVVRRAWLTPAEFANGVAVGQVTPGPLMVLIAFLGYKVAGVWGAVFGTLGLFGPSFVIAVLLSRRPEWTKASPVTQAALRGVQAAVVGMLAAAAASMAWGTLCNPASFVLAVGAAAVTGLSRKDHTWLLLAAAVVGAVGLR